MTTEEPRYPTTAVGALIYNEAGEILLVRGPKFGDFWTIPGGKVSYGETLEDALRREIREEIGVEIDDISFIEYQDAINPASFHKPVHFLFMDFLARIKSGTPTTSVEITETTWTTPEEALRTLKVSPSVINLVQAYVDRSRAGEKKPLNEDYKDSWARALADYQNLKKETDARRAEWATMSKQMILEEFIPVYDNFKKAFAAKLDEANADAKQWVNWKQGIEYIKKQFSDVLRNHDVEEIKTVGEKFDPTRHESVGEEEVEGKKHGDIVREADGGYLLGGRVIKVAKVIIAK